MGKISCIGVLTSGGDAPGMNAAIRAVTRAAIANGFRVMAIYRGYEGLINDEIVEFHTENVSNIIQRGGTILKTARSRDFETPEGRKRAYKNRSEASMRWWSLVETGRLLVPVSLPKSMTCLVSGFPELSTTT